MNRLLKLLFLTLLPSVGLSQTLDWGFSWEGTLIELDHFELGSNSSVFVTLRTSGNNDIDPGPGNVNAQSDTTPPDCILAKLDSSGNYLWHKIFDANQWTFSSYFDVKSIVESTNGNIFIAARFQGEVDVDPGPSVNLVDGRGTLIIELDPTGQFVNVTHFEPWIIVQQMVETSTGSLVITGEFSSTSDFDPSSGTNNITPVGLRDIFILKMAPSGSVDWVSILGGASNDWTSAMELDLQDNIILTGWTSDTVDLDPDTGQAMYANSFLAKYSAVDGSLINAQNINDSPGTGSARANDLAVDSNNDIWIVGSFSGVIDLDPSPTSTHNIGPSTTSADDDGYILKVTNGGQFVFGMGMINDLNFGFTDVEIDENNSAIISGFLGNFMTNQTLSADMDPGPTTFNVQVDSTDDGFIMKVSQNGSFQWVNQYIGDPNNSSQTWVNQVRVNENNSIYAGGKHRSNLDLDADTSAYIVSNNLSWSNMDASFFLKLGSDSCSHIALTMDSLIQPTCDSLGYASVIALNGIPPYTYSWTSPSSTTSSITIGLTGVYTAKVIDSTGCVVSRQFYIDGPIDTSGFDLNHFVSQSTLFTPGMTAELCLEAFNSGCQNQIATVSLVLDSGLNFVSSTVPPSVVLGDTLIWNGVVLNYNSAHFATCITVDVDTSLTFNDDVCMLSDVTPISSDTRPFNNESTTCFDISAPYDPNDKAVNPQGVCEPNYTLRQPLTYRVRFQNTGTAPANNVYIYDTLDYNLDPTTLIVHSTSHPGVQVEFMTNRVIKFSFQNIMLPDSSTDEAGSKGHILFEVTPDSGLTEGSVIENRVGIVFDFNAPIITNYTMNTIVDSIPEVNFNLTSSGITLSVTGGSAYQWVNCDSGFAAINGETLSTFTPSTDGNYAVIVEDFGCKDTSDCILVEGVSVKEIGAKEILLYPNPVSNQLHVRFSERITSVIRVFDLAGREVIRTSIDQQDISLNTEALPTGVYILNVEEISIQFIKR